MVKKCEAKQAFACFFHAESFEISYKK
ncbi:hypothetical protein LBUL_0894 [Lactobacillus delbrueckii subsp. bulgaricus ATCC BAA-365]|nr:hypothetical protein LBUL_0894 [Lactobacillus delbrueckii subsp. bulgaricus ATCC BAA-365]